MLKVTDMVDDFTLPDKDGKLHQLSKIKAKYTIIYFYPKDNTPGCTIEAKNFSDALSEFEALDSTVIGISGGDNKSKTKFCDKYELKLLLLSDPDFKVAEKFGSYGEKMFMGRTFLGIRRDTYLLDANKKLIKVYRKVKPAEHVKMLLCDIKALQK